MKGQEKKLVVLLNSSLTTGPNLNYHGDKLTSHSYLFEVFSMAKIVATIFGLAVVGLGSFAAYQYIMTPDSSEGIGCSSVPCNLIEQKPSCCQSVNRTQIVTVLNHCCSNNEGVPTEGSEAAEVLTIAPREVK